MRNIKAKNLTDLNILIRDPLKTVRIYKNTIFQSENN